jgi:hypothetical protein
VPTIKVDGSDLLRWARFYEDMPRHTKRAVARALNAFGEGIVRETVRIIADKNGWDPDVVRQRLVVQEADEHDLEFVMDASAVVSSSQDWNRPWDQRETTAFEQDTLVKIVTCDDGYDCQVCQQIAAEGPYTMSQVLEMQAVWADYVPPTPNIAPGPITNLIHPRCRCSSAPWSSYRRLPVNFQGDGGNVGSAPQHLMTMKQLARAVKDEIVTEIKVRKGSY